MRGLDSLDVDGKRVLVRVDFNVPLREAADGHREVADDTRIVAALPTIEELRARGARLVLVSHLGRPKDREPELSLAPVAARLSELLGEPVGFGNGADARVRLLENLRFDPREEQNDPAMV